MAASTPDTDLAGRTILAVFAHPDDESIACGGTLARLADAGARVIVLCASRGEHGSISDPSLVADGDLGRVRAQELRTAAAILGMSEVLIFDHPDGDLRWADVSELQGEIIAALRHYHADGVITFAADGLYWHLDHIGVHERTVAAVQSLGAAAPPLYYVTMPKGAMREMVDAAIAKGSVPPNASFWGISPDAFGDAADPPTLMVDVRDLAWRKLTAIRCHRTQMAAANPFACIDEADARRWLGIEYFRRAPIETAGASMLEQLGNPVGSSPASLRRPAPRA